jgi:hypothetical protein
MKNSSDFVVVACAVYPQLNGFRGQIQQSFKNQGGWYNVTVNTSEYRSPSCPSSVFMQLCPQYLEPLHNVTKFGILSGREKKRGNCDTTQSAMRK